MPALGFIVGGAVTALTSARVAYALAAVGIAAVVVWFSFRPIDRVRLDDAREAEDANGAAPPATRMQENETSPRTSSKPTVTIA